MMIWLMRRLHETLRHSMGVGRGEADRMVEGSDGSGLGYDEMMDGKVWKRASCWFVIGSFISCHAMPGQQQ